MTREILNAIAKAKGINLGHYSKVTSFINEAYTKVIVIFFEEEGVGFYRTRCNEKQVTLSVNAILRREEFPEDYETDGSKWIFDIR